MEDSEIVLSQKEHNQTWEEHLERMEDSEIVLTQKEHNKNMGRKFRKNGRFGNCTNSKRA